MHPAWDKSEDFTLTGRFHSIRRRYIICQDDGIWGCNRLSGTWQKLCKNIWHAMTIDILTKLFPMKPEKIKMLPKTLNAKFYLLIEVRSSSTPSSLPCTVSGCVGGACMTTSCNKKNIKSSLSCFSLLLRGLQVRQFQEKHNRIPYRHNCFRNIHRLRKFPIYVHGYIIITQYNQYLLYHNMSSDSICRITNDYWKRLASLHDHLSCQFCNQWFCVSFLHPNTCTCMWDWEVPLRALGRPQSKDLLIYDMHRYDIYSWSDTSVFSFIIKKKHIIHIIEINSVTYRDIHLIPADVRVAVSEDYSMTPGHQDIQWQYHLNLQVSPLS